MYRPSLQPFASAVRAIRGRKPMPTTLGSAELGTLGAKFHRENLVSARNVYGDVLDAFKGAVEKRINPETIRRPDRITDENPEGFVNVGLSKGEATLAIQELYKEFGYSPEPGKEGTILDQASAKRIGFTLEANEQISQGRANFMQGNDPEVVDAFPCQELYRLEGRKEEREWKQIFTVAAQTVGDLAALKVLGETGRMIARKDSPIWAELGNSVDGYHQPFPPFRFGSGMWVRDISYRDAVALGAIERGTKVTPQKLEGN